jgi:peroxiredoxin
MALAFESPAVDGPNVAVKPGSPSKVTVVCFLGTECPMARWYGSRLSQLAADLNARGVRIIGVCSNRQDSVDDIRRYIREQQVSIPLVHDEGNTIADRYGASRTPEVFVLDEQLALKYQGRIDDQYEPGVARTMATQHDLRQAIEDVLAGVAVRVPRTEAVGCLIGRVPKGATPGPQPTAVTFNQHVSRILRQHCVECHRAGEIGPFSMLDYDEVVGWGATMLESIEEGRMPPWHADPAHGKFANARVLPDEDKQTLRDWVAAGMPEGDAAPLPELPEFVNGWLLSREPDLVLPMRDRPYEVPAQGTVEYQYFVVDPKFTEDRWVTAAQVIPGSRDVVHHAIVFIRPPDGARFRGTGWLTAYVPGQRLVPLPGGYARRVPAGSKFVFQMHYTPNGSRRLDLSQVGMQFCDASQVTHEVLTLIGLDQEFEIPPQDPHHEVTGEIKRIPDNATLLAIVPHMHFRGKSFRVEARRGDSLETLLNVPRYNFNWQHAYELAEPMSLTGIDRIQFTATFDNSTANPFNPDPTQWVNWGDQSWEEMAVTFLEIAEPLVKSVGTSPPVNRLSAEAPMDQREQNIEKFVADFFAQLDTDADGVVLLSEVPLSVRRVSFWRFDLNRDEQVTRDEVRQLAESIL